MPEIFGLQVGDLPNGWIATEALVLVKCFATESGPDEVPVRLSIRGTDSLSTLDALALIHGARIDIENQYAQTMGDG